MATRTDMTPGLGLKKAVMSSEKRPETLPPLVDGLPESLRERPVWLNWRLQYKEGQGWTKVPLNPHTLKPASVTDPAALSTLAVALANIRTGEIDGVGVVLGPAKLVGFDLDDCRNPENEELIPWVKDLIRRLNTYAEVSPSGTGVKLLVIATKPGERCKAGNVEVYSDGRYFTLTGQRVPDTPAEPQPRQEAVNAVYAELFPSASQPSRPAGSTPAVLSPGDEALLAKAFAAKNGDKLKRLWDGDRTGYASESEADLALCSGLAFWYPTPDRIDAAFRRSKLYRPKWERADYRQRTLAKALEGRTEFYGPPAEETAGPDDRPEIIVTADEYCTNDAAAEALGRLPDVYVRGELPGPCHRAGQRHTGLRRNPSPGRGHGDPRTVAPTPVGQADQGGRLREAQGSKRKSSHGSDRTAAILRRRRPHPWELAVGGYAPRGDRASGATERR